MKNGDKIAAIWSYYLTLDKAFLFFFVLLFLEVI